MAHFINRQGYELDKVRSERYMLIFPKAIYEFNLDAKDPLTFVLDTGVMLQPDRHMAETDLGSIPVPLQPFFPKDEFLLSYLFHDSAYKHGGLYVRKPGDADYTFEAMNRDDIDGLLRMMIKAEGGGAIKRSLIYNAVRLGGSRSFKK